MSITLRRQTSNGSVGLDIDGSFLAAAELRGGSL